MSFYTIPSNTASNEPEFIIAPLDQMVKNCGFPTQNRNEYLR
jgi:hypothetical protein